MRILIAAAVALFVLNSCVFDDPFEDQASIPVDMALVGRWEEAPEDSGRAPNRMLVLQHSENEYLVEYPVGEKAMFFRAYAVDLSGGRYIQIQLIGTAEGAVKAGDRKYHLLKVEVAAKGMQLRTIDPDVLGKDLKGSKAMKEALDAHKGDGKLFADPIIFKRGA